MQSDAVTTKTLGATPAQLIFGRVMLLQTQYVANLEEIGRRKQMRVAYRATNAKTRKDNLMKTMWAI